VKAEVAQQRSLLEVAELDAELNRAAHRVANLAEQQHFDQVQADHRAATDRLAALSIAIEDLDAHVSRFESEIDGVRQREDRDRKLLDSGSVNPKQLEELQHELETLERRQSSLEDSLLEVMERREQLTAEQAAESAKVDELQQDLAAAAQARDEAIAEIDRLRAERGGRVMRWSPAWTRPGEALRAPARIRRSGRGPPAGPAVRGVPHRDRSGEMAGSRRRPRTKCCAAPSAARSCCASTEPAMKVLVEVDGGSRGNPGPAGYGCVVWSEDHATVLAEHGHAIGVTPTTSPSTAV